MIKIDERLLACSEYVRPNTKLVDVGTDHAYLPIYLIQKKIISKAIASDINKEPLKSAISNITKYGLEDKIKVILSDGLLNIESEEVDDIVIAGMGGESIIHIIEKANWLKDSSKNLILQPMSMEEVLRKYLLENNFEIKREKAVISKNKVYVVMNIVYNFNNFKLEKDFDEYIYVGELDIKEDSSSKYIEKQIRKLENRLKGTEGLERKKLGIILDKLKDRLNYNTEKGINLK